MVPDFFCVQIYNVLDQRYMIYIRMYVYCILLEYILTKNCKLEKKEEKKRTKLGSEFESNTNGRIRNAAQ